MLKVLRGLIRWSGANVVFNSRATERAYALPRGATARVVYNGIAGPAEPNQNTYDGSRPLRVLMLGRISRIKGQDVLVEALASLPEPVRRRIALRIVGSAFEDEARERALVGRIAEAGLAAQVTLEPFVADPAALYRWADVVTMPSQRPESLGRVAIEAMSYGVPPLVTAIGGLPEVVEDGKTGWVVPPGGPEPIAAVLADLVADPARWRDFGRAARARYLSSVLGGLGGGGYRGRGPDDAAPPDHGGVARRRRAGATGSLGVGAFRPDRRRSDGDACPRAGPRA